MSDPGLTAFDCAFRAQYGAQARAALAPRAWTRLGWLLLASGLGYLLVRTAPAPAHGYLRLALATLLLAVEAAMDLQVLTGRLLTPRGVLFWDKARWDTVLPLFVLPPLVLHPDFTGKPLWQAGILLGTAWILREALPRAWANAGRALAASRLPPVSERAAMAAVAESAPERIDIPYDSDSRRLFLLPQGLVVEPSRGEFKLPLVTFPRPSFRMKRDWMRRIHLRDLTGGQELHLAWSEETWTRLQAWARQPAE